jgi:hypothetical protein
MSLKVGGEGWAGSFLFCIEREEKKNRRRCGNVGNAPVFSKGVGQRWETGAKRPSRERWRFSTAVHRPAFPRRSVFPALPAEASSGAELGDACQQLALGALQVERGFGIGLALGEAFEFGQSDTGAEQTLAAGHLLE